MRELPEKLVLLSVLTNASFWRAGILPKAAQYGAPGLPLALPDLLAYQMPTRGLCKAEPPSPRRPATGRWTP